METTEGGALELRYGRRPGTAAVRGPAVSHPPILAMSPVRTSLQRGG